MSLITYRTNIPLAATDIARVLDASGIHRPTHDLDRIARMYRQANLVISAWKESTLVGLSRSLTDFCYCCYLSDLAVDRDYQHWGIGKTLIEKTRVAIGSETTLLLLSASSAMGYYEKVGFSKADNAFVIKRLS